LSEKRAKRENAIEQDNRIRQEMKKKQRNEAQTDLVSAVVFCAKREKTVTKAQEIIKKKKIKPPLVDEHSIQTLLVSIYPSLHLEQEKQRQKSERRK
jgi:hypothetical protein